MDRFSVMLQGMGASWIGINVWPFDTSGFVIGLLFIGIGSTLEVITA